MTITIATKAFDPLQTLAEHQTTLQAGRYGAMVNFIGTVRDFSDDANIHTLELEHYPGMTEKELARIAEEARTRWEALDTLIVHRVGKIMAGEPIVLTAAWAEHREAAFAACRHMIETLKTEAPFWKQEHLQDGTRWVTHNT